MMRRYTQLTAGSVIIACFRYTDDRWLYFTAWGAGDWEVLTVLKTVKTFPTQEIMISTVEHGLVFLELHENKVFIC